MRGNRGWGPRPGVDADSPAQVNQVRAWDLDESRLRFGRTLARRGKLVSTWPAEIARTSTPDLQDRGIRKKGKWALQCEKLMPDKLFDQARIPGSWSADAREDENVGCGPASSDVDGRAPDGMLGRVVEDLQCGSAMADMNLWLPLRP